MVTEGVIRELTRGLINEKWMNCCANNINVRNL